MCHLFLAWNQKFHAISIHFHIFPYIFRIFPYISTHISQKVLYFSSLDMTSVSPAMSSITSPGSGGTNSCGSCGPTRRSSSEGQTLWGRDCVSILWHYINCNMNDMQHMQYIYMYVLWIMYVFMHVCMHASMQASQ